MPPANASHLVMEKTPHYFKHHKVPERIKKLNPKMKLIVMIRDPSSYFNFKFLPSNI